MKTPKQINDARDAVAILMTVPNLSDEQRTLFCGMLNALVWVADGQSSVLDQLLLGEPIKAGTDPAKGLEILRKIPRKFSNEI